MHLLVSNQALSEQDRIRRLLDAFLSGRNPRTIAAYGADLADFSRYLGAADIDTFGTWEDAPGESSDFSEGSSPDTVS